MPLTFGSLFAGIGGFDLGFERAGMVCKWQVEIDDHATKVLEKHWPDVRRHRDVKTWPQPDTEPVDVICGGFPCQDISNAGKRAGLDGDRSGLFFEIIRIACEIRPRFIVLENVSALLNRGLDRVLGELAQIGFNAEWHCIPASAVGAPHQRDRVWIVAYSKSQRHWERGEQGNFCQKEWRPDYELLRQSGGPSERTGHVSNCNNERVCKSRKHEEISGDSEKLSGVCGNVLSGREQSKLLANADSQRLEERSVDRFRASEFFAWKSSEPYSGHWIAEPNVGRVAHGVPKRVDRLRCLGNSIVPQVAEIVGKRVIEINRSFSPP